MSVGAASGTVRGMAETLEDDIRRRVSVGLETDGGPCDVSGLRQLEGGVSSLTYAATVSCSGSAERNVVVKVAPPGLEPVRNRDVLRQARLLSALTTRVPDVPVPAVLWEDAELPPLFVMSLLAGDSYEPTYDVSDRPPPAAVVRERALTAARVLAHLQSVPPTLVGVEGEPVTGAREELERWARLLETVDPGIAPGHADLHARLAAAVPDGLDPTLLHGDYRLGNMLFVDGDLSGIIDWEIWSVGDPRSDLAWLLMHSDPRHRFETERSAADIASGQGMPSMASLLEAYREVRAIDVTDLGWFLACCYYKVASTVSVFVKRQRKSRAPDPRILTAAETLPDVISRANEVLDAVDRDDSWLV